MNRKIAKKYFQYRRKLYILRLRRFAHILQNYSKFDFWPCLLGTVTENALIQSEDYEVVVSSVRQRIMSMVWIFLQQHKFSDASRVLAHTIHSYSISPCWLWRVAFHILRCLHHSSGLHQFKQTLNGLRLTDENNRILETMLFELSEKDWKSVVIERSKKIVTRFSNSSKECRLTREPEINFVQRLQRLYEGLGLYALWRENIIDSSDSDSTSNAEKAVYRLKEVEALIENGIVCDIFLRPLIELLFSLGRQSVALEVLNKYTQFVSYNPNSFLYLAEFYVPNYFIDGQKSSSNFSQLIRATLEIPYSALDPVSAADPSLSLIIKQSDETKSPNPLLHNLVQYCQRLLPQPAPIGPLEDSNQSWAEFERSVEEESIFLIVVEACLNRGLPDIALDLSFQLLDHPTWCRFSRTWQLLLLTLKELGVSSPEVSQNWSLRMASWNRSILTCINLPEVALSVIDFLKSVPIASNFLQDEVTVSDDFCCIMPILQLRA